MVEKCTEINNNNNLNISDNDLLEISYSVFYYGLDKSWIDYSKSKLNTIHNADIMLDCLLRDVKNDSCYYCRTNQTSLSAYFRNMYNTIKLIDSDEFLRDNEKRQYIKIFRAQLSNPELYIIYMNVMSRFGKKWREQKYIEKYEFIKNLPLDYCNPFDPQMDFPMNYEEIELEEDSLDEKNS